MNKKTLSILIIISVFLWPTLLFGLPQLAVLDAFIPKGLDPGIGAPVTDKIIEELVNSGKFVVLDRANVAQVLKEKEFQISSDMVKVEEIREAGQYLGADFVVVARVSRVGSTYFMSARMIHVESGTISVQTSAEKKGSVDVLLSIAKTVGTKLAGGIIEQVAPEAIASEAVQPEQKEKPAASPPTKSAKTVEFGIKGGINIAKYTGDDADGGGITAASRLAFSAGFFLVINIAEMFALQPELIYSIKGTNLEIDGLTGLEKHSLNYIEIPVLAKLLLPINASSNFNFFAGPYLAVLLSSAYDTTEEVKDFYEFFGIPSSGDLDDIRKSTDMGLVLGMGTQINGFIAELRYERGLGTIIDIEGVEADVMNSAFSIMIGFVF